ncbi:MAG: hypothetical protein M1334_03085 [Patescibacteria group bacterium]|nr:hypothetical protein [Patescibacteria group bacterium]
MIDSDEAISKNLADSIKSQMKNPDGDAYGCIRLNLILGKYAKEKMPRPIIFKNNLKFKGALHENIPSLRLKYLKGFLIHNYWIDTTDWINDINTYSTNRAKKWVLENKNYGRFQLALIAIVMPFYAFTKLFFGQQRWKSGFFAGFLYSLTSSLEWVVVVLKYYEIKYKKDADVNDIK